MLEYEDQIAIAEALYLAGFRPNYSHNICHELIAGYGKLGYDFQYPLQLTEAGEVILIFFEEN